MRAIVATAQNQESVIDLFYTIIKEVEAKGHLVTFSDVRDLQITVVYEMVATKAETKSAKTRKQPTAKQLNAKAQDLFLYTIEVVRNGSQWEIRNQYGKNEVIYSCKTPTGISRKLTAMYWEKQIKMLKNEGLIQA